MFNLGGSTAKPTPTLNLFSNNTNTNATSNAPSTSIFGKPTGAASTMNAPLNQSTMQPSALATSSNAPQIDITHIRSTTKFDHVQPAIQQEITALDNAILNQQKASDELAELLPNVGENGAQLAPAIDYINTKVEELEQGLENDAEAIVSFRDGPVRRDEAELKCVFRNIDRLKVPRQYQITGNGIESSAGGASVLGASTVNATGLSGWWNQPQTLRGTRSTAGVGGQSLQLVNEDADEGAHSGPKTLVDLFDARAASFRQINDEQKRLLSEIENFMEGLEEKVIQKEREVNDRINYGNANIAGRKEEEKQRKMNQLNFVFGEVQRGLYDMADKVGTTRDGLVELGMLR